MRGEGTACSLWDGGREGKWVFMMVWGAYLWCGVELCPDLSHGVLLIQRPRLL